MSGAAMKQPVPSTEGREQDREIPISLEPGNEVRDQLDMKDAEPILIDVERFSKLSSELTGFLLDLPRKIERVAEQLRSFQTAVSEKRSELDRLCAIGESAKDLEQHIERLKQQKQILDQQVAAQRRIFEEEASRRDQENREYYENLRLQRQREEEEYRSRCAVEHLKAKTRLEEELSANQQNNQKKQEEWERDFLKRELVLKKKELEWVQLIQELEQFMSKLAGRTLKPAAKVPGQPGKDPQSADDSLSETNNKSAALPQMTTEEAPQSSISALKEILISQGKRIENLGGESNRNDSGQSRPGSTPKPAGNPDAN
jgi:hypothetical protein